jgi:hypothetical protein
MEWLPPIAAGSVVGLMALTGLVLWALWAAWRATRRPLSVLVSERGILDRRLPLGWIRWDEIEGAWGPTATDRDGLRLRLRASERLRRRLRGSREPGTEPEQRRAIDVRLDLAGSSISPVELLQEILSHAKTTPRSDRR